jgi:hypothetical protein
MIADRLRTYPRATRSASSAALIVIGGLALYNGVLAPHLGCLHAMQEFRCTVGQIAEEKDRICSTLDAKVRQWHALQREATALDEGVFTAQQARAFVRGLLPLVEQTGCTVVLADLASRGKTTRIEDPNEGVVIEASHLNLDAVGQGQQVSLLLQQLGDQRPRVWVDSCQLDVVDTDAGRMECHLALTLYTVESRRETACD